MNFSKMGSAIDTDDEISEFLNKFAFDPVFDGNDTMIDVTNVVGDRDVAVRVTAMETFYERLRPEQDVVLPTGFTLHQTRVLRALAPINAHIMLADEHPGRSGVRKVTAYVPSRAQMRLFHLLFGDQFSFEVVEHKVDGKQMPHQGGQNMGGHNMGAGPVAEVGVDTVHHAFARVRITLHLANGQTRTFEGVGMAQDIARNSDTVPLSEFYASRRSGKGVVTDAWRSAIERISPVFRSAYYEGSEMLDKVRALILRKISVAPPNIRTLGPVPGRATPQNGSATVTQIRSVESVTTSPIPRARAKAAEAAGAGDEGTEQSGVEASRSGNSANDDSGDKPAPARRGVRIGSRSATASRPATSKKPPQKASPAKASSAKASAKDKKNRRKASDAENLGAATTSSDEVGFEDEIPDFGQHSAADVPVAAGAAVDTAAADDGAAADAQVDAQVDAQAGASSEQDIEAARREIMLDMGIEADDDLSDLDDDTIEDIKSVIEKRLAERIKSGRIGRGKIGDADAGKTNAGEAGKSDAGAGDAGTSDIMNGDILSGDTGSGDRDAAGQRSADIVVSESIATAADLLAAYEALFKNNSTADVLDANKASSKRLLKAKDLAALGDLVNRFNK